MILGPNQITMLKQKKYSKIQSEKNIRIQPKSLVYESSMRKKKENLKIKSLKVLLKQKFIDSELIDKNRNKVDFSVLLNPAHFWAVERLISSAAVIRAKEAVLSRHLVTEIIVAG